MRADELRAFRADVWATFPGLGEQYAGDLTALPIAQPWFRRHQLLRFDALRSTGFGLFGARGDGTVVLLSGRLDRLAELVAREPAHGLDDDSAVAYAEDCDGWTAPYDSRPVAVRSFEDIARRARGGAHDDRLASLAREVERELSAPRVTRSGDDTQVTRCVLCGQKLVRRRLLLSPEGAMRRHDEVLAAQLPVIA